MTLSINTTTERWRFLIQGIVQGVGFRPFVYGQALQWGLTGFVLNDSRGVTIEVEGTLRALLAFQHVLHEQLPPLARIDTLSIEQLQPLFETSFVIAHSQAGNERKALISPDTAICPDCLHELFDPANRRYRYPFINCTNCGPRFTIIQDVPYDREKTTMRIFPMCPECQAEYENPLSRRFHAQPNACPVCGPRVVLLNKAGAKIEIEDAITLAASQLFEGSILAIKGLGGYHLACDALNNSAVNLLRQRKHREGKPFALMVPDLETAQQLCEINAAEATLLQSYRRPIVLLKKRLDCPIASAVAPAVTTLGIMLPYAPLHYLLLNAFSQYTHHLTVLVMTSGNMSDEPIAYRDSDALNRLLPIADGLLTHNRDIYMRCDDSVARIVVEDEQFFRRSRGYAPEPIPLAFNLPMPILACGGHLKNTFCEGKDAQAFMSHHIGDLENLETLISFREGIEHFQALFDIAPQAIAYDLHPEYLATKYALDSAIPHKIGIQHHHGHIASVLAEHGLSEQVIGIAADGTGYGTDGTIWGGEIMVADLLDFERHFHLAYVPLPGGEQAVRQPWRMAAVYLSQAYGSDFLNLPIPFVKHLDQKRWRPLAQMIERKINAPSTSSLGRLFDAGAALCMSFHESVLYEGQAAIEMEMLADPSETIYYPFTLLADQLDVRPIIQGIVQDLQQHLPISRIAGRFHRSIAELLVAASISVRQQTQLEAVALSGGVFQNRLLLELLIPRLREEGFRVYTNRRVPPNDGGLSLGQLAIAAARLRNEYLS